MCINKFPKCILDFSSPTLHVSVPFILHLWCEQHFFPKTRTCNTSPTKSFTFSFKVSSHVVAQPVQCMLMLLHNQASENSNYNTWIS